MARARTSRKIFTAALEHGDRALGWTVARLPFQPSDAWKEMVRLRVRGEIRGRERSFAFRSSLFAEAGSAARYYLLVNRAMQQGAGVLVGDQAEFLLEPDLEPRPAELPDELGAFLDDEPGLRAWYDELSESMRREIGKWIVGVKSDEARLRRCEQMAERLMLTRDAERQLPPPIERAFRARPKARAGWSRMTPVQRRGELMGVFYYQTPEARERRIAKLCESAEARAAKTEV